MYLNYKWIIQNKPGEIERDIDLDFPLRGDRLRGGRDVLRPYLSLCGLGCLSAISVRTS